ncbi:putative DNA-binding protein [Inconstantimicrobium mannanitabidum]|uniref:UPF0122 protein n=1 Tax=Inconstantimicrobium mannanitabidum TaxID=1604901 RepID=A0ACB5RB82_9CLOT|nr:putative DNA-binding protein [Clostridium sp. TW13]GKX66283.1 UPF0122 protein [Clostridium sp. TW13]
MEDRFEVSILLDFYGTLLTDKQIDIMNMYFNEDLSLGEIAEINETSRQAIHDSIKRCYKQLKNHEDKLKLKEKYLNKKTEKENLMKELSKVESIDNDLLEYIDKKLELIINI